MFPWKDTFELGASATISEFCEWVHVRIDVYIPHHNYPVKPHSSSWFSAAFGAAIYFIEITFLFVKKVD